MLLLIMLFDHPDVLFYRFYGEGAVYKFIVLELFFTKTVDELSAPPVDHFQ
jgi:hypothetical protein